MSDFRCPRYWWDGNNWRCQNLPNDYLNVHDFDTYCTNKIRCLECPYMDSEVRKKVAAYKKEVEERIEEQVEEQRRKYESEQREKENDYSDRESNNTSKTTTDFSNDSSDTGCLLSLFGIIVCVIGGLLKLLWPLIKIYFIAIWLPAVVAPSLLGWASGVFAILCVPAGLMLFTYLFVAITGVPFFLFIPYWAVLMWQKIKKQMTWKEVCLYYWKWFLKGPFAYVDLLNWLNETNTMPKIANLMGRIIEWFKKVFKKKEKL